MWIADKYIDYVKEQTVERRGIQLTNYAMEKPCRKAE